MAIITRIRKHAGLVVILVGVAIMSFVLSDLFFSGQSLFSTEQEAGEIAGNSINISDFEKEVQYIADVQKERRRQVALDEETMSAIRDRVWEKLINDMALKPQFLAAGISVCDAELKDLILGNDPDPLVVNYFSDPESKQLFPYFQDPATGKLKASSVKTYVDSLPGEEKYRWAEFEDILRDTRMQNKYLTLLKKGLYVTTAQAKHDYENLNCSVDFKYILSPYSAIPDSLVQVSDKDLLKYYNENRNKFKQDASRKLEYVIFDVKPTQQDFDLVKNQLEKLAEEWKEIKERKEDSLFCVKESDSRWFDTTHYGKGLLPFQIDSLVHISEKGTVLPIFMENNQYKLAKVTDWEFLPDSVKARHILIKVPQGDTIAKEKAKVKIDSIKNVIQKKKNFAEMAKRFSEDVGSKDSAGELGWFTIGRMVPEFQNACFRGKKGEMPIALSTYGYHLIEILDQSPLTRKTQVGIIDRSVEPGSKTRQNIYNTAVDFITKYHITETFEKGIEETHLIKRIADQLKENDKMIPGIEQPRDMIRWAFNVKKGEVTTEPFSLGNQYVVAHLAVIREEGIAPMEERKDEIEMGARKIRKAEKIISGMGSIKATSLDAYSQKLNLTIQSAQGASFSSFSIPNIGKEPKLYGALFTLKENQTSKPLAGESGVYVLMIEKVTKPPATTDYSSAKTQAQNNFSYRTDMEVIEAIRKNAEIKDYRAKFY